MANNQLKKYEKKRSRRKTTFEKKRVTSGFARVARVMGRPAGLMRFLLRPVFFLTRTSLAIDRLGLGSTHWANPGLITMIFKFLTCKVVSDYLIIIKTIIQVI
jgi:hypothetical protein